MKRKINLTSTPAKIIVAALLFIISLGLFSLIAHEVVFEKDDWFDNKVFAFFHRYSSDYVIRLFTFFSFFGSIYFLLPAYGIVLWFLIKRDRRSNAIDMGILGITSTAMLFGLKAIFARHRPELPLLRELNNYSFPSGHALLSFIFFSLVAREVWYSKIDRKWKYFFLLFFLFLSLLIGISRIVLRYHFASDVLAGLSLGLAYVLLFFWLQKKIRRTGKYKQ